MSIPSFYLIPIIIIIIAVALSFIIPAFAEEEVTFSHWLWVGTPQYYHQVQIWESSDVADTCNHHLARACTFEGGVVVPLGGAHEFNRKGCTIQTHEYFHLMGYSENEIPLGCPDYVEYTR